MAHAVGGFLLTVARRWMTNTCTLIQRFMEYNIFYLLYLTYTYTHAQTGKKECTLHGYSSVKEHTANGTISDNLHHLNWFTVNVRQ